MKISLIAMMIASVAVSAMANENINIMNGRLTSALQDQSNNHNEGTAKRVHDAYNGVKEAAGGSMDTSRAGPISRTPHIPDAILNAPQAIPSVKTNGVPQAVPQRSPVLQMTPKAVVQRTPSLQLTPQPVPQRTPTLQLTPKAVVQRTPYLQLTPQPVPQRTPTLQLTPKAVVQRTPSLQLTPQPVPQRTPTLQLTPKAVVQRTPSLQLTPQAIPQKTPSLQMPTQPVPETIPAAIVQNVPDVTLQAPGTLKPTATYSEPAKEIRYSGTSIRPGTYQPFVAPTAVNKVTVQSPDIATVNRYSAMHVITPAKYHQVDTINVSANSLNPNTQVRATLNGKTVTITAGTIAKINPEAQISIPHQPALIASRPGGNNDRSQTRSGHEGTGNGSNNAANSHSAHGLGGGSHIGGGSAQNGGFHGGW
ncbi:hypothetical protein [Enterobacter sp.]|uniref:hypothetical protein n=2 Tax=Enterobacter sp. TaxID=42895 RepID=UPI00296F3914|nr:hypothetical protein [Enterobacter sp.]